jgi:hypothetical protein
MIGSNLLLLSFTYDPNLDLNFDELLDTFTTSVSRNKAHGIRRTRILKQILIE